MRGLSTFRLTNYDGGLAAHPQPEPSGLLALGRTRWSMALRGVRQGMSAGLLASSFSAEPHGRFGSKVTLTVGEGGASSCTFVLPTTPPQALERAVRNRMSPLVDGARAKAAVELGAWWLDTEAFAAFGWARATSVADVSLASPWEGHVPRRRSRILDFERAGITLRGFRSELTVPWARVSDLRVEPLSDISEPGAAGRAPGSRIVVDLVDGEAVAFAAAHESVAELSAKLAPLADRIRSGQEKRALHQTAVAAADAVALTEAQRRRLERRRLQIAGALALLLVLAGGGVAAALTVGGKPAATLHLPPITTTTVSGATSTAPAPPVASIPVAVPTTAGPSTTTTTTGPIGPCSPSDLTVSTITDRSVYAPESPVTITTTVQDVAACQFQPTTAPGSSCPVVLSVIDSSGNQVWPSGGLTEQCSVPAGGVLHPGQTLSIDGPWDQKTEAGGTPTAYQVPPGSYRAVGTWTWSGPTGPRQAAQTSSPFTIS